MAEGQTFSSEYTLIPTEKELAVSCLHFALYMITSDSTGSPLVPCVCAGPAVQHNAIQVFTQRRKKKSLTIFLPFPPLCLFILPFNTDYKTLRLKSLPEGTK